mmetsp:Transcript_9546/g.14363  ORF Transcript_9546/g.14363 Transcript_9546/m.14363 type:complete len:113 (+) Transcript_9546:115-453(+)
MATGSNYTPDNRDEAGDFFLMEEVDEENINWGKLFARIVSLLLLLVIICCAAVGAIYEKFYLLAALVSIALVCIFGLSFLDLEVFKTRTIEVFRLTTEQVQSLGGHSNGDKL